MNDTLARGLALPISVTLIASVALVSVLGWLIKPVQRALILTPFLVRQNWQVYRLLSAGWVHTNVSHLVFNMLSFYFFAEPAMRVLGATRFLVLYLSAVIMAFVPTTLRHMRNPKYNTLGASGAVAAVMFSAILLNPKLELYVMFVPIPVPAAVFAGGYLAYSAWQAYRAVDGVNHSAHFAGALYGAMLTYAFEPTLVVGAIRKLF
jgi:membrane associated rhomboid family serine protease